MPVRRPRTLPAGVFRGRHFFFVAGAAIASRPGSPLSPLSPVSPLSPFSPCAPAGRGHLSDLQKATCEGKGCDESEATKVRNRILLPFDFRLVVDSSDHGRGAAPSKTTSEKLFLVLVFAIGDNHACARQVFQSDRLGGTSRTFLMARDRLIAFSAETTAACLVCAWPDTMAPPTHAVHFHICLPTPWTIAYSTPRCTMIERTRGG